ncbi:MAG: hypothetical protein R3F34_10225 [Planctomycetota bacterium]
MKTAALLAVPALLALVASNVPPPCAAPAGEPVAGRQERDLVQVAGTVVDEFGAPIEGVRYWISGTEQRQADGSWQLVHYLGMVQQRTTGADGRFEVEFAKDHRVDVDFDRDGYTPSFERKLGAGAQHRVVMRRGQDVTGRVVQIASDGSTIPVEYSPVAIEIPNDRGVWFERRIVTDHSGWFTFDDFLPPTTDEPRGDGPFDTMYLNCAGARLEIESRSDEPVEALVTISVERVEH